MLAGHPIAIQCLIHIVRGSSQSIQLPVIVGLGSNMIEVPFSNSIVNSHLPRVVISIANRHTLLVIVTSKCQFHCQYTHLNR